VANWLLRARKELNQALEDREFEALLQRAGEIKIKTVLDELATFKHLKKGAKN